MIKFEHTEVVGWEAAIRGMRNPKNSWDKSDTLIIPEPFCDEESDFRLSQMCGGFVPIIGKNDHKLAMMLRNAGTDHRKFLRMITVYVDITAPLYWWKEFDTYKVGTVADSCSTMHKIADKAFTMDDFSIEHLGDVPNCDPMYFGTMECVLDALNEARQCYLDTKDKDYWWQMIQLLPTSYNQKRTVMMNYEVIANAVKPGSRLHHKLDEWNIDCDGSFCRWAMSLPYSELIFGQEFIDKLHEKEEAETDGKSI